MYNALFGRKEISVGKCKLEVNCGNKFDYGENTMKKLLVLLFCFMVTKNVFAVELWNGFTSGMSENEVKQKCNIVLQPGQLVKEYFPASSTSIIITRPSPYIGNLKSKGERIPHSDGTSIYSSELEQYLSNITFYFRKGKLYAIEIPWRLGGKEIIKKAKETLGEKYTTEICKSDDFLIFKISDKNVYHWVLDEREIYFSFFADEKNSTTQFIIDRQSILQYPSEQAAEKARQQAEIEARQQRIRDNTIF